MHLTALRGEVGYPLTTSTFSNDETCGEWVTFAMRKGATQLKHLEPNVRAFDHLSHVRDTRKKGCVCVTLCAFDEVFCLLPVARTTFANVCTRNL